MTRRAMIQKWILYGLCALALVLAEGLLLVRVEFWGVHPFLLPAIAVIPVTLERDEAALLFSVFFGLVCDLLSPVTGLPCFYTLAFLLSGVLAWLLSGRLVAAGLVCSLAATAVSLAVCSLLHLAVLAGSQPVDASAAAMLAGKEALLSLPLTVLAHYPFRRVCLATQRD